MRLHGLVGCLLLLPLLHGCARHFPNYPLDKEVASNATALPPPPPPAADPDTPYVVMSFSGGGTRAAALAWAVLSELDTITDGRGHRLTDDVRIVSSVSGGSVTAAWFGLYGRDRLPGLEPAFLARHNMLAVVGKMLNPVNWVRLAGWNFSRVDLVRERFDETMYQRRTFGDLYRRPGAPLVVMNATDMATGDTFSFTRDRFDDLCSDLANFPIATAVAASSAVPIAVTPVSLKNFSGPACPVDPHPTWMRMTLGGPGPRYGNLPAVKFALRAARMRSGAVRFVHLLDGGLADNLGTAAILQVLLSGNDSARVLPELNRGAIRSLVAIEVNARSDPPQPFDTQATTPGICAAVGAVIGNPIDAATRSHADAFETALGDLRQAGQSRSCAPAPLELPDRVYGITVDFDQFDPRDPQQVALQDRVKKISTSWSIGPDDLRDLKEAGRRLLDQHPCFVRLREDLAGLPPSAVGALCPVDATGAAGAR
jgi:NTE family protein